MKRGISSIEADGCSTTYDQIAQPALARGNILDMRVLQIASVVIDRCTSDKNVWAVPEKDNFNTGTYR